MGGCFVFRLCCDLKCLTVAFCFLALCFVEVVVIMFVFALLCFYSSGKMEN